MAKTLAVSTHKKVTIAATAYKQICAIDVEGGVGDHQTYDGIENIYEPDFTVRPCSMLPRCVMIDPDKPDETMSMNENLTSFEWLELTPSGTTTIYSSSDSAVASGYDVTTEGTERGMLYIKSNTQIGSHRNFRFIGTYVHPETGYTYRFLADKAVSLEDITDPHPVLTIDSASTVQWNPLRHVSTKKITASVMVGTHEMVEDTKCILWWYRILNDGSRQLITSADDEDNWEITDVTKGANGCIKSITINCQMMGDEIAYEIRAAYIYSGATPTEPRDGDPRTITKITRDIPALSVLDMGATLAVAQNTEYTYHKAIISDNQGVLEQSQWSAVLKVVWESVTYSGTTETATILGYGEEINLPFVNGQVIRCRVEDRGALAAVVDNEGNYMATDAGEMLVQQEYD